MSRVLILHAYSADNRGDGLLVRETIGLLREAFGEDVQVHIAASYPETFRGVADEVLDSQPRALGYNREYLRTLRNLAQYDLVVGVGGGYLRGGRFLELAKAVLVHGPQLWAASRSRTRTLYLPQSIGPLRFGTRLGAKRLLARIDNVIVRDDRSLTEVTPEIAERGHDLALLTSEAKSPMADTPDPVPVLSVRHVYGRIPHGVRGLAAQLGVFDAYVQSTAGRNNDEAATHSLQPAHILTRQDLLVQPLRPRVVVAVRLHAALMALNAGHFVVHLSYERKGFGAFGDLHLSEYVHNVNGFDERVVERQIRSLTTSIEARREYTAAVEVARESFKKYRAALVKLMRSPGLTPSDRGALGGSRRPSRVRSQ